MGEIGNIQEPIYCFVCKNFNSFEIVHNRCYFNKIKFFKVQNFSSNDLNYNSDSNLLLISRNHSLKKFKVGDIIKTTGILRIKPYYDKVKKSDSIFFNTYLDSLYMIKTTFKIDDNNDSNENNSRSFLIENKEMNIMVQSVSQNLNFYGFF